VQLGLRRPARCCPGLYQRVPFHISANAVSRPEPSWETPTEMQGVAEGHEMAVSCPLGATAGVATVCIVSSKLPALPRPTGPLPRGGTQSQPLLPHQCQLCKDGRLVP